MLLLGIDIGTSSVKVSVVDAASQQTVASAQYPDTESPIFAPKPGWAEQDPELWWSCVKQAMAICSKNNAFNTLDINAIGISYQMHGLVLVDKEKKVLRNSIIWCDSRAVEIGDQAFTAIGREKCLSHMLNSPGNFTAAKLAWVKQNEPAVYEKIYKVLLPGDYIAMKLTGEITTSISAMSEGIFYDFTEEKLSKDVTGYFGFNDSLFPTLKPVFSSHGELSSEVAQQLHLKTGIPVTYKAGDQPNNALSLNVLQPGEVAATAGTSGVIYGVTDKLTYDQQSRVNTFAHVNYIPDEKRLGVLLCINGTGSLNRWAKQLMGASISYNEINQIAAQAPVGCDGLRVLPFGNGAERMLNNKLLGAHISNIDVNIHSRSHVFRAVQEGIACAFRYGLDIMRSNGMSPAVIRAGKANLFLSEVFIRAFVDVTGLPVELYENDGSVGAAIGAGIGAGIYKTAGEAFAKSRKLQVVEPSGDAMEPVYESWNTLLQNQLNKTQL